MSNVYTKLFSSITASTIWCEDSQTRVVWITMLAMSDYNGYVGGSVPGLAAIARVSLEATRTALAKFLAPDPDSRDQEHEGRRIEVAYRGWNILNYTKFRDLRDAEWRKDYKAKKQREYRKRDADTGHLTLDRVDKCSSVCTHSESESDAESYSKSESVSLTDGHQNLKSEETGKITEPNTILVTKTSDFQNTDPDTKQIPKSEKTVDKVYLRHACDSIRAHAPGVKLNTPLQKQLFKILASIHDERGAEAIGEVKGRLGVYQLEQVTHVDQLERVLLGNAPGDAPESNWPKEFVPGKY